jgi:hypothetical protein
VEKREWVKGSGYRLTGEYWQTASYYTWESTDTYKEIARFADERDALYFARKRGNPENELIFVVYYKGRIIGSTFGREPIPTIDGEATALPPVPALPSPTR